ncbi:MAG: type II secretion system protein M [Armatimonadetes bacterium]|nr:type II secretion system protein M [Armatimonadota bacterium]
MNQREKILIGIAAVVVVALGAPMAVSAFGSSEATERAIARLQTERREKEQAAERYEKLAEDLRPQVHRYAFDLPPEQLRQQIVRKVTNLAQASNVTLVTTRPLKPRPLEVLTEVSVELHLTGSLPQLVRFLHPLQQPGSRFSVDRLRLSAANAQTDLLDVNLTVSGYTLKVPEQETTTTRRSAP